MCELENALAKVFGEEDDEPGDAGTAEEAPTPEELTEPKPPDDAREAMVDACRERLDKLGPYVLAAMLPVLDRAADEEVGGRRARDAIAAARARIDAGDVEPDDDEPDDTTGPETTEQKNEATEVSLSFLDSFRIAGTLHAAREATETLSRVVDGLDATLDDVSESTRGGAQGLMCHHIKDELGRLGELIVTALVAIDGAKTGKVSKPEPDDTTWLYAAVSDANIGDIESPIGCDVAIYIHNVGSDQDRAEALRLLIPVARRVHAATLQAGKAGAA